SDAPIPFSSIVTTVQFRQRNPLTTEVQWCSKTVVPFYAWPALPMVYATQRSAYFGAIQALARYFNPALVQIELKVGRAALQGSMLPPTSYVTVSLGDSVQTVSTGRRFVTHTPRWNETIDFNVGPADETLTLSVWSVGVVKDTLIGSAVIPLGTSV